MRVIVCGGRTYRDRDTVFRVLDELHGPGNIAMLATGAAPGADAIAFDWSWRRSVYVRQFPADWKRHGRAAGPIRNQQMLEEFEPTHVIAFPGGRGTADMVGRARLAGLAIVEVPQ